MLRISNRCTKAWYSYIVASVLSGANEVYPIGFLISCDNKNTETWTTFLTKLQEACPIISQEKNNTYPFTFISDRDKGLKPALAAVVFPRNVDVHCAKHIESNVRQRYDAQCGCSICHSNCKDLLNPTTGVVHRANTKDKISRSNISGGNWRTLENTSWLEDDASLPPQYGIVTSNMAESINNMLLEARNMPSWLDATEKIIDVITTRIASNRRKHIAHPAPPPPGRIVAQVAQEVLKIQWDKAASLLDVVDLEQGSGRYKVPEHYSQAEVIQSEAGRRHQHLMNPTNNSNSNVDDVRWLQMAHLGRQSRSHIVMHTWETVVQLWPLAGLGVPMPTFCCILSQVERGNVIHWKLFNSSSTCHVVVCAVVLHMILAAPS